jgi:hypothetical protein
MELTMYDAVHVLANIDQNKWPILALGAGAMVCNYIWFFAAVWQGFRDKVYPIPIISVLFWLIGDGSVVVRWLSGHNAYDHWFLRLFSMSLILTVACELTFLAMILKFGKQEVMPKRSQADFTAAILVALFVVAVTWTYLAANLADPLNVAYFNLANMVGPAASAVLLIRRGSRAGTSTFIWAGYTAMLCCFYASCIFYYGAPFNGWGYIVFDTVNIASAIAMTVAVSRMPSRAPALEKQSSESYTGVEGIA